MSKTVDLFRLLREIPGGHRIFLRREYDKLWPIMRKMAWAYRRIILKRTRIIAVVGSLGKTTTRRVLQGAFDCPNRNFSYSNYGSCLAENLLRIRPRDRYAVIEAGVAGPGRMRRF